MIDETLARLQREAAEAPGDEARARRYERALAAAGATEQLRLLFRFKFQCPLRWEALTESWDHLIRFCEACRREVRFVKNEKELAEAVAAGECVAIERALADRCFDRIASEGEVASHDESEHACVVEADERPRPPPAMMGVIDWDRRYTPERDREHLERFLGRPLKQPRPGGAGS